MTNALPTLTDARIVVERPGGLTEHLDAWESLATAAVEPNLFYEPLMLLPAVEAFGEGLDLRFVFISIPDASRSNQPLLCGFFPLVYRRSYRRMPASILGLWKYPHAYQCAPLLRRDRAVETLNTFVGWLRGPEGASLLELDLVPGEGRFARLLTDQLRADGVTPFLVESYTRPYFPISGKGEDYLQNAVSGQYRRGMRRKEKRLGETGKLEFRTPQNEEELATWVHSFVEMEASGWKGKVGTAMSTDAKDRRWFETVITDAYRRGRLLFLGLFFDGKPIAMRCYFHSGEVTFAFKTTFDESFSASSPGVLLELEIIRRVHDCPGLRWIDSCAAERSLMDRLGDERRIFQSLVVPTGRRPGKLVTATLPMLRWMRNCFRRTPSAPTTGGRAGENETGEGATR